MNLRRFTPFAVVILFLSSCSSNNFDPAVKAINDVFGARKVTVTMEDMSDADECKWVAALSIADPQLVTPAYSTDKILSTAAMTLSINMPQEEAEKLPCIRVDLERRGQQSSGTFTMQELRRANELMETISEFFSWNPATGIEKISPLCDQEFVSDSALAVFAGSYVALVDSGGNVILNRIGGFRYDQAQIPGNEVCVVWAESQRERLNIPFTFYFSVLSGKILLVATEDMK